MTAAIRSWTTPFLQPAKHPDKEPCKLSRCAIKKRIRKHCNSRAYDSGHLHHNSAFLEQTKLALLALPGTQSRKHKCGDSCLVQHGGGQSKGTTLILTETERLLIRRRLDITCDTALEERIPEEWSQPLLTRNPDLQETRYKSRRVRPLWA